MEKENIALLLIRAIGIYIGFLALTKLLSLFSYFIFYVAQESLSEYSELSMQTNLGVSLVALIFYTFMSYYFLRKGSFLLKLMLFSNNEKKT